MEKNTIIDFINEEEVHEFASQIEKKKNFIRYSIIGSIIILCSLTVYILPDFLSDSHKNNMAYIGDDSHEPNNKENQAHSSPYNIAVYHE